MSLTKNKLFPSLLALAALALAAWALVYFTSPAPAIANEGDTTVSQDGDDPLNVKPKPRRRPQPVKNSPPPQPDPTPPSNSGPSSPDSPPSQPRSPSNSNSGPQISANPNQNSPPRAQAQQYTETIQERNNRLATETKSCVNAAKAAGLWNNAWDNEPWILMFIANSGKIPVNGDPRSGLATSNLSVWLHQVRTDEYSWFDRQSGQNGAWSPHILVYSDRLDGC